MTRFARHIWRIDSIKNATGDQYQENFLKTFKTINKLAIPVYFTKMPSNTTPQIIIFGEIGNGKSTTGNALSKELLSKENKKFTPSMAFAASKSTQAVTTQLTMKCFTKMNIMDTPGFNDPDKKRTDQMIMSDILTTIQNDRKISDQGVSALLSC